jgi:hypothetical protein
MGLLLDMIGAFFLAESFVVKRREQTLREASDYYDGNPHRLRSAVHQAIEGRVGFACLLLGFSAQFAANTDWFEAGLNDSPLPLATTGLVAFGVLFTAVRIVSRRASRRAVARAWGRSIENNLGHEGRSIRTADQVVDLCFFYGHALDLKRNENETSDLFADRIVTCVTRWRQ